MLLVMLITLSCLSHIDESENDMNISTVWLSDSCLRVEWIPLDTGFPAIYYTIRFQPFASYECGAIGGVTDEESVLIYHEGVSSSNIVCNLSPYSRYYLSITAMTTEGEQEVDKATITPIRSISQLKFIIVTSNLI